MTQEEKAKAYDEALERFHQFKEKYYRKETHFGDVLFDKTGEMQKEFGNIFHELQESEDERIKNKSGYYKAGKFWKASTLWNAVKDKSPQRVPNRYILQECTWNISSLQHFADEVKNVQEVDLNYPIILDMNGNILDGAHRVVKAYLEGKDIDIVYLGDDEWPEPDYDEEKAVKESEDERIRKALIEGVRQIRCKNGITQEQMIAYLEKQKENIEKEYVFRPLAGTDITIAAEQAIRRANEGDNLVLAFNGAYIPVSKGCTANKIVDIYDAYIEKQKEQKPAEKANCIMNIPELTAFEQALTNFIGYWEDDEEHWPSQFVKKHGKHILDMAREELKKEKKPVQFADEREYVRTLKGLVSDFIRSSGGGITDTEYYQKMCDWLDGRHVEQKPAEWSEDWREEDIQTRFAFYTYKDDSSVLYLSNVFVEEASRNHGFGTKILVAAERVAETIGATTISLKVKQNSPAMLGIARMVMAMWLLRMDTIGLKRILSI